MSININFKPAESFTMPIYRHNEDKSILLQLESGREFFVYYNQNGPYMVKNDGFNGDLVYPSKEQMTEIRQQLGELE